MGIEAINTELGLIQWDDMGQGRCGWIIWRWYEAWV